jgi:ubiquinone/menaquinone biosynthesis C-methylase UbiE
LIRYIANLTPEDISDPVEVDCEPRCDFAASYEVSKLPALKSLEREVLGCDYGGTSWTTIDQVAHIVSSLRLGPEARLLEAGSGSGWPGIYLSRISGCSVTLLDLPLIALTQAGERAADDGILDRVHCVSASATAMPFDTGSFECISHSDVLCCLPDKRDMLEECRRVIGETGRMHFSVIRPGRGLTSGELARAIDTGPPFVEIDGRYSELLPATGWRVTERLDVSTSFADTLQRFVAGFEDNAQELEQALGASEFYDVVRRRKRQIKAVRAGILQRFVFVAAAA